MVVVVVVIVVVVVVIAGFVLVCVVVKAADAKLPAVHSLKMLLQYAKNMHGGDYHSLASEAKHNAGTSAAKQGDAKKQMAALKSKHGILGLADILITPANRDNCANMVEIIRPTLTVFCRRIKDINTPSEHKAHFLLLAAGKWQHECIDTLYSVVYQRARQISEHGQASLANAMSLSLRLSGQRASSHWALHAEPPYRYIQLLCGGEVAAKIMKTMKTEWKWLQEAEHGATMAPESFAPLDAITWRKTPLTRQAPHNATSNLIL